MHVGIHIAGIERFTETTEVGVGVVLGAGIGDVSTSKDETTLAQVLLGVGSAGAGLNNGLTGEIFKRRHGELHCLSLVVSHFGQVAIGEGRQVTGVPEFTTQFKVFEIKTRFHLFQEVNLITIYGLTCHSFESEEARLVDVLLVLLGTADIPGGVVVGSTRRFQDETRFFSHRLGGCQKRSFAEFLRSYITCTCQEEQEQ